MSLIQLFGITRIPVHWRSGSTLHSMHACMYAYTFILMTVAYMYLRNVAYSVQCYIWYTVHVTKTQVSL